MSKYFYLTILEIYYGLSTALTGFLLMEIIWPKLVLAHININIVLIFWLITGIFILLLRPGDESIN